jgi:hypothetical protein
MQDQEIQKDPVQDAKDAAILAKTKLSLIQMLKTGITNFFKRFYIKLRLKFKAFLAKMKKLFMQDQANKRNKILNNKPLPSNKREIPSVLKDVADLDNKVDLFLQTHHNDDYQRANINYQIIEKIKQEEDHKHNVNLDDAHRKPYSEHLERKSPIEKLSLDAIDIITGEILQQKKVKSFIERELARHTNGSLFIEI